MAVVLLVLGAICFVGAYGAGKLCAEMLLTPACAALAYAAYQAEKNLFRPAPKAPVLRVAAKATDTHACCMIGHRMGKIVLRALMIAE